VIRVLVASDVRLYRDGLAEAIDRDERFDVVAVACSTEELLQQRGCADVVLLATEMPGALATVPALAQEGARVLALAVRELDEVVIECVEAGVAGFVTRDASLDDVLDAVASAARGESPSSPTIVSALMRRIAAGTNGAAPSSSPARLTRREREIVALIEEGLSNKQIAAGLSIELSTVKNHVHHILEKLNVSRRDEAAHALRRAQI
jgi:two-component system nitrate/nitrite response regulator NarL